MRARRHLAADGSQVVLHDDRTGHALALGEREWAVVAALDGTRDVGGVAAAAAKSGAHVSQRHVQTFVRQLASLGLLASTEPTEPAEPSFARDLAIVTLPGWGYRCDGRGGCCQTFSTVLFTPLEAAVARATLPGHHSAGPNPAGFFTPERGLDASLLAAPLERGRCSYLDAERRCRLHTAGGAQAKPHGCRTHPLRYLDVGTHIRAAPRPECACLFVPAEGVEGVPETGSQLPRETYVARLRPADLALPGVDAQTPASALLDWLDALPPPDEDGAGYLEWVARSLERTGLATPPPRARVAPADSLDIRQSASRLAQQRAALQVDDDLVRRAASWLAEARPSGDEPPGPGEPLYVQATVFTPPTEGPLAEAWLRAAARLRLARALDPARLGDPAASPPIALVEALVRGYSLDS